MQNIAVIFLMLISLAILIFLVYISFKLLNDSQKKMREEKQKNK